jgi:hypothetical protein
VSVDGTPDEAPRDERAARRDQRRAAARERMQKHGGSTATVYRNAVLKRLRKKAGRRPR